MADSINTINVGGIDKEVEDTVARNGATSASNRLTAVESGLANLEERVEEIIAPSGEAPSAAEVADARIADNGKTFSSLGNAIRNQVNDLSNLLTGVNVLPAFTPKTGSANGITYSVTADSINISAGTATGNVVIDVIAVGELKFVKSGKYFLSGIPSLPIITTSRKMGMYVRHPEDANPLDNGLGAIQTIAKEKVYAFRFVVYSGYTNTEAVTIRPKLVYMDSIDTTLSQAYTAADAKTVGDKLSSLSNHSLLQGLNIFPIFKDLYTQYIKIEDNEITYIFSGDAITGQGAVDSSSFIPIKSGKYFIYFDDTFKVGANPWFYVAIIDVLNNTVVLANSNNSVGIGELIAGREYVARIVFRARSAGTAETITVKPVLKYLDAPQFNAQELMDILSGKPYSYNFGAESNYTLGGVNISYVDDTIVVKKDTTPTANVAIDSFIFKPPISGNYLISGLPSGITKVVGYLRSDYTNLGTDTGSGVICYLQKDIPYVYRNIVYAGYSQSEDVVIRPRIAYLGANSSNESNPVELSFLGNASLGDCNILEFVDGSVMMIDCMIASQYSKLKSDLANRGITKINYFVISHYHEDHVGNVVSLINDGYIDSNTIVYMPTDLDTTYDQAPYPDGSRDTWINTLIPRFTTVKNALVSAGCNLVYPTEGQEVVIGNARIKFVNCDHSYYYGVSNNYNDWSLCCYLFNGDISVFYSGDVGPIAMEHIAANIYKANIYKSDHHGWANNVNGLVPDYINRLVPDVVISENSQIHINNGYIDSKASPIQAWCECNGVSHYMTVFNNHEINVHIDKYNWKFKDKYIRYIRGTNHKNWKWIDNDTEYAET